MTATYTWDVFCTLVGYGSYAQGADWAATGASKDLSFSTTASPPSVASNEWSSVPGRFGSSCRCCPRTEASEVRDPWVTRMRNLPATVVSSAMENPLDWPDATVVRGDASDVVASLKEESDLPLRSHGSLSLNWTLMAAGLVDRLHVTIFPVVSGRSRADPIFDGVDDFDLELLDSRILDGHTQELVYRPTPR